MTVTVLFFSFLYFFFFLISVGFGCSFAQKMHFLKNILNRYILLRCLLAGATDKK